MFSALCTSGYNQNNLKSYFQKYDLVQVTGMTGESVPSQLYSVTATNLSTYRAETTDMDEDRVPCQAIHRQYKSWWKQVRELSNSMWERTLAYLRRRRSFWIKLKKTSFYNTHRTLPQSENTFRWRHKIFSSAMDVKLYYVTLRNLFHQNARSYILCRIRYSPWQSIHHERCSSKSCSS